MVKVTRKEFYAPDRAGWRKWLEKNHLKEEFIWLVLYNKNGSKPSVTYPEAVEEALCFGWIDSKANKRDHESRFQYFAKRKPNGMWSLLNKQRVAKLKKLGLMHKAGAAVIALAKKTGAWDAFNEVEALQMPDDLQKALARNKKARQYFDAFPPSSRKIILYWILSARQPETRKKRIRETVRLAAKNMRANHWSK